MTATAPPTAAEIARHLELFIAKDQVTELRALNVGGPRRTVAGWFDGRHLFDMARTAVALTRQATGVYFIPNPVRPDLLARCPNRAEEYRRDRMQLTTDADILERRYLIVDLDRCDGNGDQSSTDAEVQDAVDAADAVATELQLDGWRTPLKAMSGNGVHLFFPLSSPLPPKYPAHEPDHLRDVLDLFKGWRFRDRVKVDGTTFNASRIIKLPGTWARKGEATADRPHRLAKILEIPDDWNATTATAAHAADPGNRSHVRPEGPHADADAGGGGDAAGDRPG